MYKTSSFFNVRFSCSMINCRIFSVSNASSGRWNLLLTQEQTLMSLQIINQEETLVERIFTCIREYQYFIGTLASLCFFLKCCLMLFVLQLRFRSRLQLFSVRSCVTTSRGDTRASFTNTRWPSDGGCFFVWRLLVCGIETGLYLCECFRRSELQWRNDRV